MIKNLSRGGGMGVLLIVFSISATLAQQSPMTLKSCIDFGLKNHRSNVVSQNNIRSNQAKIQEARAGYLPSINLNGSLDNNLKVQQSIIPGAMFGRTEDIKVAFTQKYNTNVSAQVDQTIYDQSLITSYKANQYSRQQMELKKKENEETIIYNVSSAYYQVFVNRQQVQYLTQDLENYLEQLAIAQLKVDKEVMLEVDRNKIQVNYNNTLSQLNSAASNVTLAENQLKNAMGLTLTEPIQIDTTAQLNQTLAVSALSGADDFNVTDRTDYKLSIINISLLDVDTRRIRATGMPKLTAYGRYGANAFGKHLSEAFNLMDYSAIGVKLSIPLFDGLKRNGQARQANYETLNAIETLNIDKQSASLEYENVRTQLLEAQSSVDNDKRTLELARAVFETTDLQFQKGVTDITDWLETQRTLKESQSNYLNSLFKFYLSLVDLEKAKGTLKNFYNSL